MTNLESKAHQAGCSVSFSERRRFAAKIRSSVSAAQLSVRRAPSLPAKCHGLKNENALIQNEISKILPFVSQKLDKVLPRKKSGQIGGKIWIDHVTHLKDLVR